MIEIRFRRIGNIEIVCNIHPGNGCIVQRDMQRVRQFFKCKSGVSPRKVDNIVPVKELAKTAVADGYSLCRCSDSQVVNMGGICGSISGCGCIDIQITSNRLDKIQLVGINRFKIYIDSIEYDSNKYFVLKTILICATDSSEVIE